MRLDHKGYLCRIEFVCKDLPLACFHHHAEVRDRYLVPRDWIRRSRGRVVGDAMTHQLVAEQIKVDPIRVATTLGAAQLIAKERPRRTQAVYRNRQVKGC